MFPLPKWRAAKRLAKLLGWPRLAFGSLSLTWAGSTLVSPASRFSRKNTVCEVFLTVSTRIVVALPWINFEFMAMEKSALGFAATPFGKWAWGHWNSLLVS